jgi:hypothetical protein
MIGAQLRALRLLWEGILAIVLVVMLIVAATHLAWIRGRINEYVLILIILLFAFGLYLIRYFFRFAYGIVEIFIGLLSISGAMARAPQIVDDSTTTLLLVQTAAGIYIIVRGIDNLSRMEPFIGAGNAFRELWRSMRNRSAPPP